MEKLYLRAKRKAQNKSEEILFERLAKEEQKHKKKLMGIPFEDISVGTKELPSFAESMMLTPLTELTNLKLILEKAIKSEESENKMYKEMAKASKLRKYKELFTKLAKEETGHKVLLKAEYKKMFQ